jgi:hypothetical protein
MTQLRLYAPALVLTCWALLWSAGLRTDLVLGIGFATTAVACYIAEYQRGVLRRRNKIKRRHRRGT